VKSRIRIKRVWIRNTKYISSHLLTFLLLIDSRIFYYFIGWDGKADAAVKRLTRRCGNSGGESAGPLRFAGAPKSSSGATADTGEVRVAIFRKVFFRLCSRVEIEQFGAGPAFGNPFRNS
jgi:hypothetical protein